MPNNLTYFTTKEELYEKHTIHVVHTITGVVEREFLRNTKIPQTLVTGKYLELFKNKSYIFR
jgi:hypothetical protein